MKMFTDSTDRFIAEKIEDIPRLIDAAYGSGSWDDHEYDIDSWVEVKPGEDLTITFEDEHDGIPIGRHTKKVSEWIQLLGEGLASSTEF